MLESLKTLAGLFFGLLVWIALLALNLVSLFATPFIVAMALPLANQYAPRVFPAWLDWLNTPDDPGPNQGMYEPQVAEIYKELGWRVKTWYWLGIRNQVNGLFAALAPVTSASQAFSSSAPLTEYPETKGPYRAGRWFAWARIGALTYWEFMAVGAWSASRCWQFRIGWKLEPLMTAPGPVMFCLEIKPFLTINSAT